MVGHQRAGTLKAFVRVSKNSEGAAVDGKKVSSATLAGRRMSTRSQSAKSEAGVNGFVVATERRPSTKRKSGAEEEEEAVVVQSQSKRVATKARPSMASPSKKKRATTIGTYFHASPKANTAPTRSKDNQQKQPHCPENSMVNVSDKTQPELLVPPLPIAEDANEQTSADTNHGVIPQPLPITESAKKAPEEGKRTTKLRAKTNALLEKLRNRKRPSNDDTVSTPPPMPQECSAAPSEKEKEEEAMEPKINVTRAIQERIRERREAAGGLGKQPEAISDQGATFEAARVKTAADAQMHELKRQFVAIQARSAGAPLNSELRKLDELFQGLEHVALFGGQVGKGVVYHKVRKGVESMAKRTFGWKELGQILAIYPEAYAYEPVNTTSEGRRVVSVVLTPLAQGINLAVGMEARRDEFRRRLVARMADAHSRFLVDRGFSATDVELVAGWHPSFDIEATPSVVPIPLPPNASRKLAVFDKSKLKHLLGIRNNASDPVAPDQAASTVSANESSKSATLGLPTPSDSPVIHPSTKDDTGAPSSATSKIKKSLASSAKGLLERIRAKQRAKETSTRQHTPSIPLATRSMYSRLPAVLDAISFLYYSERKSVLQLYYVAEKISESKGLDRLDALEHIVALARFVPEWCTVVDDNDDDRKNKDDGAAAAAAAAPPQPDARLKIMRALSAKEAKEKLAASIAALSS
ncbi:hypothetical protein LPJ59_002353 [Coemansia sp. RSA 2399]|nr:hypothetical protein LPJ59_002353 [Coemansia sp. RSA 2399]